MPPDDNRREVFRVTMPVKAMFNVLQDAGDYRRSPSLDFEIIEPAPDAGDNEIKSMLLDVHYKLDLLIALLIGRGTRKQYTYHGRIMDMSETGFRMVSPVRLKKDTPLELGLVLPVQPVKLMDIAGTVAWARIIEEGTFKGKCEVGIRITDILPHDQDQLFRVLFQKKARDNRSSEKGKDQEVAS